MKGFYLQFRLFQWTVALVFLLVLVALFTMATLGVVSGLGWRVDDPVQLGLALGVHLLLLLPLWMLLGLFFMAPLFRLLGVLRYYSPYLVVTRSGPGRLDLHGATPFDYLLLFRWRDRGRPAVRRILCWYLDGLIALAREMERGEIPIDTTLSATSYIFSRYSAQRYGFRVEEAPRFALGGLLTYPTQLLTYSFARGRWAFPPIRRARRATIDGTQLCAQRVRLEHVRERLGEAPDSEGKIRPARTTG